MTGYVGREPAVHVPTVQELAEQGLAKAVAWTTKGEATHYRLTPEGQRRIGEAMRANGSRR